MLTHDIGVAGFKVAPPITVFAITLNEWVAIATVVYLVLQGAHLIWKWRGEINARRAARGRL